MPRKLRLFNGRGDYGRNNLDGHLYVCATSKAEAVRLLKQAGYPTMTMREFDEYWAKDAWGNTMEGIAPEKGVWIERMGAHGHTNGKPERLL